MAEDLGCGVFLCVLPEAEQTGSLLSKAEVSQLRHIRLIEEDVVMLDVQVHESSAVHEVNSHKDAAEPEPGHV